MKRAVPISSVFNAGLLVFLVAGVAVWADEPEQVARRPDESRAEMLLSRLRESLHEVELTGPQKPQIEQIIADARRDLTQSQNLPPEQRQQMVRETIRRARQKANDVLTEGQRATLQERARNREQRRGRMGNARRMRDEQMPANPGGAGPLRVQATLGRLQDALASLELRDEQRQKAQAILDEGRSRLRELSSRSRTGELQPDAMRQEIARVFAGMRDQLNDVLSPAQQEDLRQAILERPALERTGEAMPTTRPMMQMETMESMEATPPESQTPRRQAPVTPPVPADGPKVGDAAPELDLERLDARPAHLAAFKGKPLVLVFGSHSSPSFRQRASQLEQLAKQYGHRAHFLVIYTKEAHPSGVWEVERNRDDGVRIEAHPDTEARKAAAKVARQALKLTVPIAIDTMDNRVSKAYGAGPNSAFVISRDGAISARQGWCDPFRLRTALDEALMARTSN